MILEHLVELQSRIRYYGYFGHCRIAMAKEFREREALLGEVLVRYVETQL